MGLFALAANQVCVVVVQKGLSWKEKRKEEGRVVAVVTTTEREEANGQRGREDDAKRAFLR